MIKKIKRLLRGDKRAFSKLCQANGLPLRYAHNADELGILRAIFHDREYADYFPFYKKATVVDIGAHFGYFSIFAHQNLHSESVIYAVEPNSFNFNRLKQNLADCQIPNVHARHCAIGGANGTAKLHRGESPNHSIMGQYRLAQLGQGFEEVPLKTLEAFMEQAGIAHIDFLKMDCEGAEYAIFQNTPPAVFDRIGTISMEFHDLKDEHCTAQALMEKLTACHFKIVKFHYAKTSLNLNYGKLIGSKV